MSQIDDTSRGTHYVSHWFDGFAQTHKFDILPARTRGGPVSVEYSSRRQSDGFVAHIKKTGWRSTTSFGQRADPCVGLFAKIMSVYEPRQWNNNVVVHPSVPGLRSAAPEGAGHRTGTKNIFIGTDNNSMQELHADTLEPIGFATQNTLHPELKGPLSCAHAQRDPANGDFFNFNLELGRSPTYRLFRVNAATGTTDILATVCDPATLRPAYIHSLFLTDKYVVLCVNSAHYGWSGLKIPWERNLLEAIQPFDANRACQWLVVDRRHDKGLVARFSTPAGFNFHTVNAFDEMVKDENDEERTDITLEMVDYATTDIMFNFYYDVLMDRDDAAKKHWLQNQRYKKCHPRLVRYRFRMPVVDDEAAPEPLPAGTATAEEVLAIPSPHIGELPTINPAYACKPHRYVYSNPSRGLSTLVDSIGKTDVRTRETVLWCGPAGHSPGEPIFVARPGEGLAEDDGVLLSMVLDGPAQRSYLLCLDARTMTEMGRAEAEFAIGMGFHGAHERAVL